MKAFLILSNGEVFEGESIGSQKEVISEIVFNTSMTGYLEVLTDPSYYGQSVCMTYPLIGNYGIAYEDMESDKVHMNGFIMHEIASTPSNFRCEDDLISFLVKNDVAGIAGIDTRKLTTILRENGTMNGMITTNSDYDLDEILPRIKEYSVTNAVMSVTTKEKYTVGDGKYNIALLDFGYKKSIVNSLVKRDCKVTVYPADTKASEIINENYDGIMLSNGPGDPKENVEIIKEIKKLYDTNIPIFAICLGHQLMALSTGANTKKLKYGHRGGNHPVKDLINNKVYITAQNHGYYVEEESLDNKVAIPAFINVNDKTNEGLKYIGKNIFTVQFHPEAAPGPLDSGYLFDMFIEMIGGKNNA